eukprot:scaffold130720_cov20-Tisochrysis_lutea.AAC.3
MNHLVFTAGGSARGQPGAASRANWQQAEPMVASKANGTRRAHRTRSQPVAASRAFGSKQSKMAGSKSNGSEQSPWPRIQQRAARAAIGSLVQGLTQRLGLGMQQRLEQGHCCTRYSKKWKEYQRGCL